MFSSLPDYRRFAETTIRRIRKDRKRMTDRPAVMMFNVLLLAGLWGVPLYARWLILANNDRSEHVPETIVGKWRTTDGSHFSITFTADGHFELSWKEAIIETARYWFRDKNQHEAMIADFREQPGDRVVEGEEKWWFRVIIERNKLSTTFSISHREQVRKQTIWHRYPEIDGKRFRLLPAIFERVE